MSVRDGRPARRDPALLALLAASLLVSAWGIDWGLPSPQGWALDEVLPASVLDGMSRRFSNGWHDKYPPFHYYLLSAMYWPVLRARGLTSGEAVPPDAYHALFLLGRALSVVMALGTVLLVYLCGREALDRRASLLAAALAAFMVPFVFYGKLANLDVPYLFWWTSSLLFLLRGLKRHRGADYLLFALAAVFAVCTKDQAYGLYVLTVPLLLVARRRHLQARGEPAGLRAVFGRDVLLAALAALVLFAAVQNLAWNRDGVRAHFALIAGPASRDFQEFPNDVAGHAALLGQTWRHVRFTLGTPAFVVCLMGLAVAFLPQRREPLLLALLVPGVSYYLFFIAVVLYGYDRFTLPLGILLSFFGGRLLSDALSARGWRGSAAGVAVVALLGYGIARAASVDLLMVNDSRYAAEAWLRRDGGPEALLGAVGPPEHLPRLEGLRWRVVGPRAERLARIRPDYLVINADYGRRALPGTGERDFYDRLQRKELGYTIASEHLFRSPLIFLDVNALREPANPPVLSNIGKVNPLIRIYQRRAD